jgi:hypothetical protein
VTPAPSLPERDAEAIKRSYGFVIGLSTTAWVLLAAVLLSVGVRSDGDAMGATLTIAVITGCALLCWVLFLRGLRRRELERVGTPQPPPEFQDPGLH